MTSNTPISRLLTREGEEEQFGDFVQAVKKMTAGEALSLSEFEWMSEVPKRDYIECNLFLNYIANRIVPQTTTALELYLKSSWIPSGLIELDSQMRGFRPGQLIEIVGRAGAGKTQWCMTIGARMACKQKRGVVYFDSERKFSIERFLEILSHNGGCQEDANKVHVIRADEMTSNELSTTLKNLESMLLTENIGLMILDSITAITRVGEVSIIERQNNLSKLSAELKYLAEMFNIPVLVTNQVINSSTGDFQTQYVASLGNTWHHVVNVRLYLSNETSAGGNRSLKILKSPDSIEYSINYSISAAGIVPIHNSQTHDAIREWNEVLSGLSPAELESL